MKKNQGGFIYWMIPFFTMLLFLIFVTLLSIKDESYWVTPFGIAGIAAMLYWIKRNLFDDHYENDVPVNGQEEKAP